MGLLCRFSGAFSAFLLSPWPSSLHILALSASLVSDLNPRLSKTAVLQVCCASLCCGPEPCFRPKTRAIRWHPLPVFHLLGIPVLHWHVSNIRTQLFPTFGADMYCLRQEDYSNTSSSAMTRSRSEFPVNFDFPLAPETYPKTVFYSLLCALLFFFLNPPSSPYHLPKYLAFKVLINNRNWKCSPTRGSNLKPKICFLCYSVTTLPWVISYELFWLSLYKWDMAHLSDCHTSSFLHFVALQFSLACYPNFN